MEHLKKVFAKRVSPCKDLCCGVPIVSPKKRENCEGCPLPDFFSRILESEGGGVRCVLGKKEKDRAAEYVLPWKRRKEPRYIHPKN